MGESGDWETYERHGEIWVSQERRKTWETRELECISQEIPRRNKIGES